MMNMFDEAQAMAGTLALCKITQGELAARLGVSQSYVANKLRLLSLPEDIRRRIVECGVSERHARSLLRIEGEARRELLEKIISRHLTVRECEALVDAAKEQTAPATLIELGAPMRVQGFCDSLKGSVAALRSLGVEATAKTGYYGNKMYITICICDV